MEQGIKMGHTLDNRFVVVSTRNGNTYNAQNVSMEKALQIKKQRDTLGFQSTIKTMREYDPDFVFAPWVV